MASILGGEVRLVPVAVSEGGNPLPQPTSGGTTASAGWTAIARQFEALWVGGDSGSSLLAGLLGAGGTRGARIPTDFGEQLLSRLTGNLLGSPLGLLAGTIGSLFRKRRDPQVFETYDAPESFMLDLDIGDTGRGGTSMDDSGRNGSAVGSLAAGTNAVPPVLIQVNAMDARSFSDHRDDIAAAVREALTRSHSLRDEIWEE